MSAILSRVGRNPFRLQFVWLLVLLNSVLPAPSFAQTAPSADQRRAEVQAAWDAAGRAATLGPAQIPLVGQGTINLPKGDAFIPQKEANAVMVALGNTSRDSRVGLIVPQDGKLQWLVDLEWIAEGYVRDGDAKEWQPDAMLDSLKEGTKESNKDRVARGIPAIDITGWVEQPTYDNATHKLVWSLAATERGSPANTPQTINYNTYALGRDGYFSLDLITGSDTIETDKGAARQLLANLTYEEGKRYTDFNASTDRVAAYGLAGLIGAVAIKKMGLLALAGAFLLKAWKIALFVVLGGWAAVRRWFRKLLGRDDPEDHQWGAAGEQEAGSAIDETGEQDEAERIIADQAPPV